jgi:hypothetical protein
MWSGLATAEFADKLKGLKMGAGSLFTRLIQNWLFSSLMPVVAPAIE